MIKIRMVKIADKANVLSAAEKERLQTFIVGKCYSYVQDREWLRSIIIRRDGPTDYLGYWSARYKHSGAHPPIPEAVIVLNATYLLTVEQMERTLAHEYGHHWTLCYLINRELLNNINRRLPMLYYRLRGLDPHAICKDYNQGWDKCDKEILAEDYRCLVTSCTDGHQMESAVGPPSSEVRIYIERFGRLHWRR